MSGFPGDSERQKAPFPKDLEVWASRDTTGKGATILVSDLLNAASATPFDSVAAVRLYITDSEIDSDFFFLVMFQGRKTPAFYDATEDAMYYIPFARLPE